MTHPKLNAVKTTLLHICLFVTYIASATVNPPSDPNVFLRQAKQFALNNQKDSAAHYYHQAAREFGQLEKWEQSIRARQKAGDLYFGMRQSHKAIASYQFLLDSLTQYLDDSLMGEAFYKIGLSYARLASFAPALENMKASAEIRSLVFEPESMTLATTYHMLGRLYFVVGDYRQSLRYQQRFMEIIQANFPDGHPRLAEAYQYVGLSYSRLYEHEMALQYYRQTLDILQNEETLNTEGIASTYNNMGLVYGRMGETERELEFLQKALSLREKPNSAKATNTHNIGRAYLDLKDYQKAQQYLHKAARMKKLLVGPRHSTVATTYKELAHLYREQQMYDSTLSYLAAALAIEDNNFGRYGIALSDVAYELGRTHELLGHSDTALMYYQKAIAAVVQDYDSSQLILQPSPGQMVLDKKTLSRLLHAKSEVLFKDYQQNRDIHKLRLAYDCSKLAVDHIEEIYGELNDQNSIQFLAENANEIYEHCLSTILLLHERAPAPGLLPQAFAVMEKNKARLLLQSIAESRWKNQSAVDDSLLTAESELKAQIAYYEKLRFEEHSRSKADSLRLADIQKQLFSMNEKLLSVRDAIRRQNPKKHQLLYQPTYASLGDVQQLLQEDELLLEYFEGTDQIYGMAISPGNAQLFQLTGKEDFRAVARQLTVGLREKNYDQYTEGAYQVYHQLLANFSAIKDNGIKKLIIVPDGQLGYIPFEALLSKKAEGQPAYHRLPYLIRDYTVAYQYSASLLTQTVMPGQHKAGFLGYAPEFNRQNNPLLATRASGDRQLINELEDLPYAREEVIGIAEMLRGEAYVASEATESHFKKMANRGRILHLASHTLINDQNPLYSRLVFSPNDDSGEDGLLHTYELYNMNLGAEMVTLSACNTGLGKIRAGEGIISLARGFMYAGVSNVMMSLWAVSDRSTSQLMQYFYESLDSGKEKAEALRDAKLRYLQSADANTAAPYYWSAFVLISSEQNHNSGIPAWLVFVLILGTSIFVSWFFINKKFT